MDEEDDRFQRFDDLCDSSQRRKELLEDVEKSSHDRDELPEDVEESSQYRGERFHDVEPLSAHRKELLDDVEKSSHVLLRLPPNRFGSAAVLKQSNSDLFRFRDDLCESKSRSNMSVDVRCGLHEAMAKRFARLCALQA